VFYVFELICLQGLDVYGDEPMGLKGNVQASRVWKEDIDNLWLSVSGFLCPDFFYFR